MRGGITRPLVISDIDLETRKNDVRLCPKCGETAVVLVTDWKHTQFGRESGESTKDYRCQGCGKWFIKKPKSREIAYWILGAIFTVPCGFGIPWLYLAWRLRTFDRRVQRVEGAPLPPIRYPGGPPKRRCAKCEGVATAVKITRHTHNGVPTGTDHEYQCEKCGLTFETEDALGHTVGFFASAVVLGISAAFFFGADSAGWKYGGSIVSLLVAGVVIWQGVERLLNRKKHAAIEGNALG
jgi:hypothetical protein